MTFSDLAQSWAEAIKADFGVTGGSGRAQQRHARSWPVAAPKARAGETVTLVWTARERGRLRMTGTVLDHQGQLMIEQVHLGGTEPKAPRRGLRSGCQVEPETRRPGLLQPIDEDDAYRIPVGQKIRLQLQTPIGWDHVEVTGQTGRIQHVPQGKGANTPIRVGRPIGGIWIWLDEVTALITTQTGQWSNDGPVNRVNRPRRSSNDDGIATDAGMVAGGGAR